MIRYGLLLMFIVSAGTFANDVIPKVGDSCPTGSYASGDYCKAFKSSADSSTRVVGNPTGGKCPTGWYRSGDYCKAYSSHRASENVIERAGDDCPRGFYKSGAFCKSYK